MDGTDVKPTDSWQTSRSGAVYRLLILVAYLLVVPGMVLGPMILALWLSDHTHEFGPWDPRYFLLVSGSDVEKLGVVEPFKGSVSYAARGQDGNAPAKIIVEFGTMVPPERVIEIYEARCAAIGLDARKTIPKHMDKLTLHCGGKTSDLGIGARRSLNTTHVTVGGWEF